MALPEYTIIETAKLARADVIETYPELAPVLSTIPIELDRGTKRKGVTWFRGNKAFKIGLSKYFNDRVAVDNTTRHELAHAVAGHAAGHGPQWQAWAVRFGIKPDRCTAGGLDIPKKPGYTMQCPKDCGTERTFQKMCRTLQDAKRGASFHCRKCSYTGMFRVV